MARIGYPDAQASALADRIVAERGSLLNLYRMLLHNPGLTEGWLRLGTAIVFELSVDDRTRELVTCSIAASTGASYEWHHHSRSGARLGVTDAELVVLASGDRTPFGERDRAVLDAVDVIGRDPAEAAAAIDALRTWFDDTAICELTILIGFYWMVTRVTLALDIEADP